MPRISTTQEIITYEDHCDVCSGVITPIGYLGEISVETYGYVNPEKNLFVHHNCVVDAVQKGDKYVA